MGTRNIGPFVVKPVVRNVADARAVPERDLRATRGATKAGYPYNIRAGDGRVLGCPIVRNVRSRIAVPDVDVLALGAPALPDDVRARNSWIEVPQCIVRDL